MKTAIYPKQIKKGRDKQRHMLTKRFSGGLSRKELTERLGHYGFTECATLLIFLDYVCEAIPERCELTYIRDKAEACLNNHDNGSRYFRDLRTLVREIDFSLHFMH
ncbi:hypothetical protein [Erwinia persicina]|uniref:Uncharacterized protein n=1 Tax=Erwinia persicina TaxID=55211 RepID=A0A4U3EKC2_9GAMM|nr:hypothetical protein [Erwinia persicina]MBD8109432.1 hypothetical protein [Erwinia persicina]MBD8170257.1 hypothetical protein [Erwinia persicina]MBD8212576.1 hypothetical protein [Erwinia persicina]TKJ80618.1 hypothetical protein EpCFBP13511_24385 [Erwinia persicina]